MNLKDLKQFTEELNSAVKVKNLNGTVSNDKKCNPCTSWIKHWERLAEKPHSGCAVLGCSTKINIEGGHVLKCKSNDDKHYIIPLCDKHNNSPDDDEFEVVSGDLMSAIECRC